MMDKLKEKDSSYFLNTNTRILEENRFNVVKDIYSQSQLTDVKIVTEEQEFDVHKLILASASPVFRRIFERNSQPNSLIYFREPSSSISALINFIYTGEASVPRDNLKEFLVFAAELKIFGLMEEVIRREADDLNSVGKTKQENTDEIEEETTECKEDLSTKIVDEIHQYFGGDVTLTKRIENIDEEILQEENIDEDIDLTVTHTTESLEEQTIVDYNNKDESMHVTENRERNYSSVVTLDILEKLSRMMIDLRLPMSQIPGKSFLPETTRDKRFYIKRSIKDMLRKCKANIKLSPKFLNSADAEEKIRCLLLILKADEDFKANVR